MTLATRTKLQRLCLLVFVSAGIGRLIYDGLHFTTYSRFGVIAKEFMPASDPLVFAWTVCAVPVFALLMRYMPKLSTQGPPGSVRRIAADVIDFVFGVTAISNIDALIPLWIHYRHTGHLFWQFRAHKRSRPGQPDIHFSGYVPGFISPDGLLGCFPVEVGQADGWGIYHARAPHVSACTRWEAAVRLGSTQGLLRAALDIEFQRLIVSRSRSRTASRECARRPRWRGLSYSRFRWKRTASAVRNRRREAPHFCADSTIRRGSSSRANAVSRGVRGK
jgi:hypothetical protein